MNVKKILPRFIDVILVIACFFLTNSTAFSVVGQFPDIKDPHNPAWSIVGTCGFVLIVLVIQISLLSYWGDYQYVWKKQFPLIIFIVFCIITLIWTIDLIASFYELVLMVFAVLIGVYLAVRYTPERGFELLLFYAGFSIVASYLLLIFIPPLARLDNPEFLGAWRGIFWHRNHMGSLMAFFSALFILKAAMSRHHPVQLLISIIFFVSSTVLVFGSLSATGILIFIVLNGFLFLAVLWLKFRTKLTKKDYHFLAVAFGIVVIFVVANLDFVFGILGRNSTLTGRIPIWTDLVSRVWVQKPILGYGFGSLWNLDVFRISMQLQHGWPYQVYFSDNGYLDLLLNTGMIGLLLFLVFFFNTGLKCAKVFLKSANLISLFPLLLFLYVLWANISYSFLFEVDQFVWMLLVIAAVTSTRMSGAMSISDNKISNPQP